LAGPGHDTPHGCDARQTNILRASWFPCNSFDQEENLILVLDCDNKYPANGYGVKSFTVDFDFTYALPKISPTKCLASKSSFPFLERSLQCAVQRR
jgi:hypothetical protein